MFKVESLDPDPGFGCIIHNITMADIQEEENLDQLRQLWIDRGLIYFADTDVTSELHVELSKVFGKLEHHFLTDKIVDGNPELVAFSSYPEKDGVHEVDGEMRSGFIPWHMDFWWMTQPNHGGILRVATLPNTGGDTGFMDLISLYDRLPEDLKARIEDLEIVSKLRPGEELFYHYPHYTIKTVQLGSSVEALQKRPDDFPSVAHRLVRVQEKTGRKYLNFSPLTAVSIIGMAEVDSDAMIDELADYATDDRFAYMHKWKMTDMVLWDNLRMMHLAAGVPLGEERVVQRTTILCEQEIGRRLEEGGWKWSDAKTG